MAIFRAVLGTWNAFGTPQNFVGALTGNPTYPARYVSNVLLMGLEDPDILCTQELFSGLARDCFDGLTGFAQRHRDKSVLTDSTGLGIATRLKVVHGPVVKPFATMASGVDALVKKGFIHLRVALTRGPELDVITTHLQADGGPTERTVREGQLAELAAYLNAHTDPTRPLVVCGDMNVDGLRRASGEHVPEYQTLKASLKNLIDTGAFQDLPTLAPATNSMLRALRPGSNPARLDYIFFRPGLPNDTFKLRASQPRYLLASYLSDIHPAQWLDIGTVKPCPPFASDHFGLSLELSYEARP